MDITPICACWTSHSINHLKGIATKFWIVSVGILAYSVKRAFVRSGADVGQEGLAHIRRSNSPPKVFNWVGVRTPWRLIKLLHTRFITPCFYGPSTVMGGQLRAFSKLSDVGSTQLAKMYLSPEALKRRLRWNYGVYTLKNSPWLFLTPPTFTVGTQWSLCICQIHICLSDHHPSLTLL